MYISSLVFFSSVAMCTSGLRISTPAGRSMSLAVMSPGPVTTSGASISVASECIRHTMPLRLRTMSVTSSVTPLIVENSCATPSIRTLVTGAARDGELRARRVRCVWLLGVQLDDELLLHWRRDLTALGLAQHLGGERVVVGLEPGGHLGGELRGVADQLARLPPRCGEAEADEHVVEAALEQREQVLARDALLAGGLLVVVAE